MPASAVEALPSTAAARAKEASAATAASRGRGSGALLCSWKEDGVEAERALSPPPPPSARTLPPAQISPRARKQAARTRAAVVASARRWSRGRSCASET